jgi:hypothetical protein
MAAVFAIPLNESAARHPSPRIANAETREQLEFAGVFRGRELTRKDHRSPSGLPPVDSLLDGGIVRSRERFHTSPQIFLIAHFVRCAHVADSFARCAFGSASDTNRAKPASGHRGRCGTSQRFHVLSPSLRLRLRPKRSLVVVPKGEKRVQIRRQPVCSWPKRKSSGWIISARISNDSTIRGPGRLKY